MMFKCVRFVDLLNRMRCDFFEISVDGDIEHFEWRDIRRASNNRLKQFYEMPVLDFYPVKAKQGNQIGLLVRLAK